MIIHNFHVKCIAIIPNKADAPLQINTNAILTLPVTL